MGGKQLFQDDGAICEVCGKVAYGKRRAAMRKGKILERRAGRGRTRASHGPMEAYQCPHGNGWHIGHRRKSVPVTTDVPIRLTGAKPDAEEHESNDHEDAGGRSSGSDR